MKTQISGYTVLNQYLCNSVVRKINHVQIFQTAESQRKVHYLVVAQIHLSKIHQDVRTMSFCLAYAVSDTGTVPVL
jgi:hypothetical protein